jgi:N-methylhydantoinase B
MLKSITTEIIREYFETVAMEVIETMVRAAASPIFNEAHDCSAGVFHYDGKEVSLVSRGDAVPVHIYACLTSVDACIKFFRGDLDDGDVMLVCDPYFGGTHIADYTIVKPVFCNNKPLFFISVRAHMLDVGGPQPCGTNVSATEVWQEGFRFPPVKVFEQDKPRRDVWDLLRANNRLPDVAIADINAMIGACKVGADRVGKLLAKYGATTVKEAVAAILDHSERLFRKRVASWPRGRFHARSLCDTDFHGTNDINVDVTIEVKDDEVFVDFTGSHAQCPSIINSVPGNTLSYVYGCFSAACPDIPINSGFFRPISARLPPGTIVNATSPAAAAYATICIGATIGEAVEHALEKIVPRNVATTTVDLCAFWAYGIDPRTRRFFISYDFHSSAMSAGAAYGVDGWGAWSVLFCSLKLASLEMTEIQYPFLYLKAEYTTDSAAPGQWRGAPAYEIRRMTHGVSEPIELNIWLQSTRHTLRGFVGGGASAGNAAIVHQGTQDEVRLVAENPYIGPSASGDITYFLSGGGGGWGSPFEREPDAVLSDALNEYVSLEGARRDYGVVINPDRWAVDERATVALRAEASLRGVNAPRSE